MPELPPAAWLWVALLLLVGWALPPSWRLPIWIALGWCYAWGHALLFRPADIPEPFLGQDLVLEGQVVDLPRASPGVARFFFRAERLAVNGEQAAGGPWRLRLNWYGQPPRLESGETWRLQVRLTPVVGYRNPGGFDYAGWLWEKGVAYRGKVRQGQRLAAPERGTIDRWRQGLSEHLAELALPPSVTAVLRALAVGDRGALTPAQRETFRATGTSHLMAISGLHIGLVAGLVYGLVNLLWRLFPRLCIRWPAQVAAAVPAMGAALGYAALAGFSIPTQRALVMLMVVLAARMARRHLPPAQVLTLALLAVVVLDPFALRSAGFWLSFGAVAILLLIFSRRSRGVAPWIGAQLALSFGLLPLLLAWGMPGALVSPLVNWVAIPFFSFLVVPGLLLGLLLVPWWPMPLMATGKLLEGGLDALEWAAQWNLPLGDTALTWWLFGATVVGVLAWLRRWRWLLPGVALSLALPFAKGPAQLPPGRFEAALLDVGQGLAVVVRTHRHGLVYDAGPAFGSGFDTGRAVVLPFLAQQGIKGLDALVVSHGDRDHAGGVASLLEALPVTYLWSGEPQRLALERAVMPCRAGEQWWWDGVHFQFLGPLTEARGNNASCILRVASGQGVLLLTGDLEADGEARLVARWGEHLRATLVVAAHHGSAGSSSAPFVAATRPQEVLFSAGFTNPWRFPRPEVVARWCGVGARPWNTAYQGAIVARLGPKGLEQIFAHGQAARRYWHFDGIWKVPEVCDE